MTLPDDSLNHAHIRSGQELDFALPDVCVWVYCILSRMCVFCRSKLICCLLHLTDWHTSESQLRVLFQNTHLPQNQSSVTQLNSVSQHLTDL